MNIQTLHVFHTTESRICLAIFKGSPTHINQSTIQSCSLSLMNCNCVSQLQRNLLSLHARKLLEFPVVKLNELFATLESYDGKECVLILCRHLSPAQIVIICLRSFKSHDHATTSIHKSSARIDIGKKHYLCSNGQSQLHRIRRNLIERLNSRLNFRRSLSESTGLCNRIECGGCLVCLLFCFELLEMRGVNTVNLAPSRKEHRRLDFQRLVIEVHSLPEHLETGLRELARSCLVQNGLELGILLTHDFR